MRRPLLIFSLGMVLLGLGCSPLPQTTSITVAGLVFYYTGTSPIHKASLRVSNTHGLVACGIILPGKECSTTFPQREYHGSPVIITWEQAGQSWTTGEFNIQLPAQPATAGPSMAIVSLGDHGTIDVRFTPQASTSSAANKLQP